MMPPEKLQVRGKEIQDNSGGPNSPQKSNAVVKAGVQEAFSTSTLLKGDQSAFSIAA